MSFPRLGFTMRNQRRSPRAWNGLHAVRLTLAVATVFWALTAALATPSLAQVVPELQINSAAYIVIDADTGEVYAQRDAHERAALASLTKIFTAIEAIERGSSAMEITTRRSDMQDPQASLMGFGVGETFTLQELLYGMMLPSGNDAAHAIARALGHQPGDSDEEAYERFVGWMNERVQNMGLTDTQFVNSHGWGVPGHYSTVGDVAAFTRYALQYPAFVDLISTADYTTSNGYELHNNNRMLNWYTDIVGGKTGYDWDAGWCLVVVAQRGDSTMISVTFNNADTSDDMYDDNRVLLDYAFEKKTEREADGAAFAGDVITFRDPDAVVIAEMATSAGTLPRALATGADDRAASDSSDATDRAPSTDAALSVSGSSSETARLVASLAIAVLLIGGRVLIGMAGQPMPRLSGVRLFSAPTKSPESSSPPRVSP